MGSAFAVRVDMTEKVSIVRMVDEVLGKYGRVDVLINNARQSLVGKVEDIQF